MSVEVQCPFCGEWAELQVDPGELGEGEQVWVQDCEVCCHPWTVRARSDHGSVIVEVQRD